jgi:hypothetical protein
MNTGHRYWPAVAVVLSVGLGACGNSDGEHATSSSAQSEAALAGYASQGGAHSSAHPVKPERLQHVDGDAEDVRVRSTRVLPGGRYDGDDVLILHFGRPADAADRQAITTLVDRYRTAVVANDGPRGCALLYSVLAESVTEDHPQPPGSHNTTCGAILTILFKSSSERRLFEAAKLRVIEVQTRQRKGLALMGTRDKVEHTIEVRRERGRWRIAEISGSVLG